MKKNHGSLKNKAKTLSKKNLTPVSKSPKRKTTTTGEIYATYSKAKPKSKVKKTVKKRMKY